jgi:hypothetical protein
MPQQRLLWHRGGCGLPFFVKLVEGPPPPSEVLTMTVFQLEGVHSAASQPDPHSLCDGFRLHGVYMLPFLKIVYMLILIHAYSKSALLVFHYVS